VWLWGEEAPDVKDGRPQKLWFRQKKRENKKTGHLPHLNALTKENPLKAPKKAAPQKSTRKKRGSSGKKKPLEDETGTKRAFERGPDRPFSS